MFFLTYMELHIMNILHNSGDRKYYIIQTLPLMGFEPMTFTMPVKHPYH